MKLTGKILFTSIFLVICAICASSAFAASAIKDLRITDPGPQALEAGKTATFSVSFAGSGIEKIAVQPSGAGLSAKIANVSWKPYPNTCAATVSISSASNFQGGKIAFLLINSGRTIQSQTITVSNPQVGTAVAIGTSAAASGGCVDPNGDCKWTTTDVSIVKGEISKYENLRNQASTPAQKDAYQKHIDKLNQYRQRVSQKTVGLGSDPGPMPSFVVTPPPPHDSASNSRATVAKNNGWLLNSNVNPADPALPATNSDKVSITANDVNIEVGKSLTLPVKFGPGQGAYHTALQSSGPFTTTMSTNWQTSPFTSNIAITPEGSKGGTIKFMVHNSAGRIIGSKTINVTVQSTFNPIWPVPGNYGVTVLSKYTRRPGVNPPPNGYHSTEWSKNDGITGMDISAKIGTTVVAVESGTVETATKGSSGFGNYIIIKHNNGIKSLYGHLNEIDKKIKQAAIVSKGQTIGKVGKTGNAYGAHLHFEFSKGRPYQDYFKGKYPINFPSDYPAKLEINGTIW